MPLLSQVEYAAHRGVSAQAVSKAIKAGRLRDAIVPDPEGGKKPRIDSEVADREWQKNTDQAKARGDAALALLADPEKKSRQGASGLTLGESEAPGEAIDYQKVRARREMAQAKLAELELAEKAGLLVPADQVQKEWVNVAAIARTKVTGIASKARQRIPELTPAQLAILELLIREALEDLSQTDPAAHEVANAGA